MRGYRGAINQVVTRCGTRFAGLWQWARFGTPKWLGWCRTSWAVVLRRFLRPLGAHPIAIATSALTLFLLYEVVTPRSIVILPLSVPKQLRDSGYTADVAATRLRDVLNKVMRNANTRMQSPELALRDDLPDFVVPTVGVSIESVASFIRTFLRIERRQNISGEFTINGDKLSLRLRRNGLLFHDSKEKVNIDRADELIQAAVADVVDATVPYLNAVIKSNDEPTTAVIMARRIIADRPETDPNVRWAHNLIGTIRFRQERFMDAMGEFNKAIELDHRFATAYNNLGLTLRQQDKIKDAVKHFHTAIRYDADFADAHQNLASALTDLDNIQGARCERQRAIIALQRADKSNPRAAVNHRHLGDVVEDRSVAAGIECGLYDLIVNAWNHLFGVVGADLDSDDAVSEYQEAIKLDSEDAMAYMGLGLALLKESNKRESDEVKRTKSDEAILAFRDALRADDRLVEAHVNLANELYIRARINETDQELINESNQELRKAIAVYERLIKLEPDDFASKKNIGNILLSLGEINSAINVFESLKPTYFAALADRGYAEVDAGQFDNANEHLTQAVNLRPRDTYAVLWLHLARRHANHSVPLSELQVIKTLLERESEANQWPLPIVRLFMELGTKPDEILGKVKGDRDHECEANFYVGEWYLFRQLPARAAVAFQQSLIVCPRNFIEFPGAQAELNRLR